MNLTDMVNSFDHFPSFSEGLSLRDIEMKEEKLMKKFPFLFGGTFIEGLS